MTNPFIWMVYWMFETTVSAAVVFGLIEAVNMSGRIKIFVATWFFLTFGPLAFYALGLILL